MQLKVRVPPQLAHPVRDVRLARWFREQSGLVDVFHCWAKKVL